MDRTDDVRTVERWIAQNLPGIEPVYIGQAVAREFLDRHPELVEPESEGTR